MCDLKSIFIQSFGFHLSFFINSREVLTTKSCWTELSTTHDITSAVLLIIAEQRLLLSLLLSLRTSITNSIVDLGLRLLLIFFHISLTNRWVRLENDSYCNKIFHHLHFSTFKRKNIAFQIMLNYTLQMCLYNLSIVQYLFKY